MPALRQIPPRAVSRVLATVTARDRFRDAGDRIVLTYDDGPDERHTPRILTELAAQGSTATFFVLLTRCRRAPSLLRELASAGHEIALHGPDHRPMSEFSGSAAVRRILDARAELEDLAQVRVRRYRPPYGLMTTAVVRAARSSGMRTLLWNRDVRDWLDATEDERVDAGARGARGGDVLLAHDARADAADGADDPAAADFDRARLTGRLVGALRSAGLRCTSAATVEAELSTQ